MAETVMRAAIALGIARSTLRAWRDRPANDDRPDPDPGAPAARIDPSILEAERGNLGAEPVLPDFRIVKTTAAYGPDGELRGEYVTQKKAPSAEPYVVPTGHVVKGESAFLDPYGRVLRKWVKTREGAVSIEAIVETLKSAFDNIPAAKPTKQRGVSHSDLLALYPLADLHVGLHAWGKEVGPDWDLRIAEEVLYGTISEIVDLTPAAETAIVLVGGDIMHADNGENRTARSGNVLDVDGRYPKVLATAERIVVHQVEAALAKHKTVIVRVLPGNHDEHAAVAIAHYTSAWYRNEPRVNVDVDPGQFFWHRFGAVMLGSTHGHAAKIGDMPMIMAHRRAADWGATRFRYVHGFHLHHKRMIATEGQGCVCEVHQSPVPQDGWHYASGFLSGRSMKSIAYHREFGERYRSAIGILDAGLAQAA